jgi:hypothetical protein
MDCLSRHRTVDDTLFLRAGNVIDLLLECDKRQMTPQDVAEKLVGLGATVLLRNAS